jgi:hypothetical protein
MQGLWQIYEESCLKNANNDVKGRDQRSEYET